MSQEKEKLASYLNEIIEGDCIQLMKELPENSIHLIFADPPYNLQLNGELYRPNQTKVDAVNDDWDKFSSFGAYDEFTYNWLKECKRVLKKNGTIWVIGSYHNIFRVGKIIQDLGFWILNDVVWIKTNPMPNFKGTRFNNAHETLIWASENKKSKYTFHYKSMKAYNDDKQMRSDWSIPICNGRERAKLNGKKAHSTQKPEALLKRVILSSSNPDDIVLDPFMGTGTTAVIAKNLRRNYIGFEKFKNYVKIAKERISNVRQLDIDMLSYLIERKEPKVPFGNLIEQNLIRAGEYLYSKNERYKAKVLANATLQMEDNIASIHKLSAKLLDKESNNGWKFWYVERANGLKSIDILRKEYREKYIHAF